MKSRNMIALVAMLAWVCFGARGQNGGYVSPAQGGGAPPTAGVANSLGGSWGGSYSVMGGGTNAMICNPGSPLAGDLLAFNTSGICAPKTPGVVPRVVSGTTDLISCISGTGDRGGLIIYTSASAVAVTIPQAGTGACTSNFYFRVLVTGAGTVTFTPAPPSTINFGTGAQTSMALTKGTANSVWADIISDNTNYTATVAIPNAAGGSSTNINLFQQPPASATTGTLICSAIGNTYGYGFWLPYPGAFGHIAFNVQTADATNNYTFGIYNTSGTRVAVTTAAAIAATGRQTFAFTATWNATAGEYYMAAGASTGACAARAGQTIQQFTVPKDYGSLATGSVVPASITAPVDSYLINSEAWFDLEP